MLQMCWLFMVVHVVFASLPFRSCSCFLSPQSFARGCNKLRTLKLAECKQISDVGLLQVSNHCPGLEVLDVSRAELAFKVTDVALLALGERCRQLTDVNLSGCSFLTDAGIDWLAGGCRQLVTLRLPGLYKLTDTGVWGVCVLCLLGALPLSFGCPCCRLCACV